MLSVLTAVVMLTAGVIYRRTQRRTISAKTALNIVLMLPRKDT